MPFCDLINFFASLVQALFNEIYTILGQPLQSVSDVVGSFMGCNITA